MGEIEAAAENYDEFAIKVDSDNVKATNYFAYSNPTSSLMNASGHSFCYVSEVSDKRDSMYNLTWAIIAGGMVLYTIASTVAILNAKRKARKNQ